MIRGYIKRGFLGTQAIRAGFAIGLGDEDGKDCRTSLFRVDMVYYSPRSWGGRKKYPARFVLACAGRKGARKVLIGDRNASFG